MVRFGELAQLVERCDRTAEVRGSTPLLSTAHNHGLTQAGRFFCDHALKEILPYQLVMSQSKREQVISHLRYIRQELREIHQGVQADGLLPEPEEVRAVIAQMEALLELLVGRSAKKAKDQDKA